MKILHILYSGLGGHGNVLFSQIDADLDKEFHYEIIFFGIEEVKKDYTEKLNKLGIGWNYVRKKTGIDIKSYLTIKNIISKNNPDIVFLHSSAYIFPALLAQIFTKRKFKILTRESQAYHLKSKLEWIGLAVALIFSSKIIFLSNEFKQKVSEKLKILFRNRKAYVIPNGINLSLNKPSGIKNDGIVRIGMQSRLSKNKDHVTLLQAFALVIKEYPEFKNLKLVIAGDGECRSSLEKLANELNLDEFVEFKGMLNDYELYNFMNSLFIYVHTTFGETMSTAIMQAMAFKLPIIASNVLGVNNMLISEKTALLVELQNIEELKLAIFRLLENKQLAKKIATSAYEYAIIEFSNIRMFKQYKDLFIS